MVKETKVTNAKKEVKQMWRKYDVELTMTGHFAASLPKTKEEIELMLKNRMPKKPPVNFVPIPELADVVVSKIGIPVDKDTEEVQFGYATFCRDKSGLYYEGRCIRGHLKDCATQVKSLIPSGKEPKDGEEDKGMTALKAKVANKVYVMTDVIYLGRTEVDGTEERFIQIMTIHGPRSTIKYIDYLIKPSLKFRLNVLNDGVITDDILTTMFDYGSVHGLGQERSQGWGRYEYTITEVV